MTLMLGDVIARLRDGEEVATLLATLDARTIDALAGRAEADGVSLPVSAVRAVDRFCHAAPEDAWTGLIGAMHAAALPGRAALRFMVRWDLDAEAA